jgi:hypothetical protein
VQLNILELYSKAQSKQLEAPEVAWLESQAREFPYFSMVHTILARHHLSNKSTIKDRALSKSALYAKDRSILRKYLSDVIVQPKMSPPVSIEKKAVAPKVPEELIEETPDETSTKTAPVTAVESVQEVAPEENRISAETSEKTETIEEIREVLTPSDNPEEEVPINWFLNMRLKLRSDKYTGRLEKVRNEIVIGNPIKIGESAAPAPAIKSTPVAPEKPATVLKTNPIATESTPTKRKPTVKAPESESTAPENTKRPAAKKPRTRKTSTRVPQKKAAGSDIVADDNVSIKGPDYEIGAFSNFTFLDDSEPSEADESEIDSMMPLAEAVEFATDDTGTGPGQITFEEKDRIVEVTVSPEELQRYFKGRLPVELNFSPAFEPAELEPEKRSEKKTPEYSGPLTEEQPASRNRRAATSHLIERFIEEEPTISRIGDIEIPSGDLAASSARKGDDWVTETLAQIYEKQGNKSRAIGIYEKLALRFPEKSNYFADLIQKIK